MNPGSFKPTWTDERVAHLKEMWDRGMSAGQCAKELGDGLSRNAVIGKVHRMGWQRDEAALKATRQLRNIGSAPRRAKALAQRTRHNNFVAINSAARAERIACAPRPRQIPKKAMVDYSHAKPWTERGARECAFPIGQGGDLLSCCAPTEEKHTYCTACEGVMFRPEQPTKKSTMRIARLAA